MKPPISQSSADDEAFLFLAPADSKRPPIDFGCGMLTAGVRQPQPQYPIQTATISKTLIQLVHEL